MTKDYWYPSSDTVNVVICLGIRNVIPPVASSLPSDRVSINLLVCTFWAQLRFRIQTPPDLYPPYSSCRAWDHGSQFSAWCAPQLSPVYCFLSTLQNLYLTPNPKTVLWAISVIILEKKSPPIFIALTLFCFQSSPSVVFHSFYLQAVSMARRTR